PYYAPAPVTPGRESSGNLAVLRAVARGRLAVLEADRRAQLLDVLVQTVILSGYVFHQIGEPVSNGVELVLGGLVVPGLGVLQERDQQERDDRRHGVDQKLPGVELQERHRRPPYENEQHARGKEGRPAGDGRGVTREPVKEPDPAADLRGHVDLGLAHVFSASPSALSHVPEFPSTQPIGTPAPPAIDSRRASLYFP